MPAINQTPSARSWLIAHALWCLAAVTPFVIYLGFAWHHTSNLPFADDYPAIIDFLVPPGEGGSVSIWAQHNEHRIVFTKVVSWLQYHVCGRIDFRLLALLGNLGWCATVALISLAAIQLMGTTRWQVLPFIYLLLVPIHEANMIWAMAALQNFWSVFFAICCFYFLARDRPLGSSLALAAVYLTSGNGVIAFAAALAGALLTRRWRSAGWIAGAGLVLTTVYFIHYRSVSPLAIGDALHRPAKLAQYSLAFLGSWATGLVPAMLAGSAIIGVVFISYRLMRMNFMCVCIFLFVLGVATAAALARSSLGVSQAMDSRYAVYSVLILGSVYLLLVSPSGWGIGRLMGPCLAVTAALFGGVVCGRLHAEPLARMKAAMRMEFLSAAANLPSHRHIFPILERARQQHAYDGFATWAATPLLEAERTIRANTENPADRMRASVDQFDGRYIQGWAHLIALDSGRSGCELCLRSEKEVLCMPAIHYLRPDLRFEDGDSYEHSGFLLLIPIYNVPPGSYEIGLRISCAQLTQTMWTGLVYKSPALSLGAGRAP